MFESQQRWIRNLPFVWQKNSLTWNYPDTVDTEELSSNNVHILFEAELSIHKLKFPKCLHFCQISCLSYKKKICVQMFHSVGKVCDVFGLLLLCHEMIYITVR